MSISFEVEKDIAMEMLQQLPEIALDNGQVIVKSSRGILSIYSIADTSSISYSYVPGVVPGQEEIGASGIGNARDLKETISGMAYYLLSTPGGKISYSIGDKIGEMRNKGSLLSQYPLVPNTIGNDRNRKYYSNNKSPIDTRLSNSGYARITDFPSNVDAYLNPGQNSSYEWSGDMGTVTSDNSSFSTLALDKYENNTDGVFSESVPDNFSDGYRDILEANALQDVDSYTTSNSQGGNIGLTGSGTTRRNSTTGYNEEEPKIVGGYRHREDSSYPKSPSCGCVANPNLGYSGTYLSNNP